MKFFVFYVSLYLSLCTKVNAQANLYECPVADQPKSVAYLEYYRDGCRKVSRRRVNVGITETENDNAKNKSRQIDTSMEKLNIKRGVDGYFQNYGKVNGQTVRFIVDTGASAVSVSDHIASAASLIYGHSVTVQTANGKREGKAFKDVEVSLGGLTPTHVTVVTGADVGAPGTALLGMSFLKFYDVQISGDEMILSRRNSRVDKKAVHR